MFHHLYMHLVKSYNFKGLQANMPNLCYVFAHYGTITQFQRLQVLTIGPLRVVLSMLQIWSSRNWENIWYWLFLLKKRFLKTNIMLYFCSFLDRSLTSHNFLLVEDMMTGFSTPENYICWDVDQNNYKVTSISPFK